MSETKMTTRDGFRLPTAKEWLHPASYWEAVAREQRARADAAEDSDRESLEIMRRIRADRDRLRERLRRLLDKWKDEQTVTDIEGVAVLQDCGDDLRAALAGEESKP